MTFGSGNSEDSPPAKPQYANPLKDLPKLKPCPKCGKELEYWSAGFVACKEKDCDFTGEIELWDDEENVPSQRVKESTGRAL